MTRILQTVLMMLLLQGCGEKDYSQRVFNDSGQDIDNVVIHFGSHQNSFGVFSPNSQAMKMSMTTPPPKVGSVTWTDEKGKSYSVDVDLSIVPKDYGNGVITFTIEKEFSVSVGFFMEKPMKLPSI